MKKQPDYKEWDKNKKNGYCEILRKIAPLQPENKQWKTNLNNRYEKNEKLCNDAGVDIVFAPSPAEMYPDEINEMFRYEGLPLQWIDA